MGYINTKFGVNIVALTCVKYNSNRLPYKNIKLLHGKPLIQYTIDFCNLLGINLFLYTRDIELMQVINLPLIYEPLELREAKTNVIIEIMKYVNIMLKAEYIILYQPTCPIRDYKLHNIWIRECIENKIDYAESIYKRDGETKTNGAFYFFSAESLNKGYIENQRIFSDIQNIDIDTQEDFNNAEKYINEHKDYFRTWV